MSRIDDENEQLRKGWALDLALDGAERNGYQAARAGHLRCCPYVSDVFTNRYNAGYDCAVYEMQHE